MSGAVTGSAKEMFQQTFRAASAWALRIFSGERHADRMLSRSCCTFAIAQNLKMLLPCASEVEAKVVNPNLLREKQ